MGGLLFVYIITSPATAAAYRVSGGLLPRLVALGLVVCLPIRPRVTNMTKQARLTKHFLVCDIMTHLSLTRTRLFAICLNASVASLLTHVACCCSEACSLKQGYIDTASPLKKSFTQLSFASTSIFFAFQVFYKFIFHSHRSSFQRYVLYSKTDCCILF